MQDQTPRIKTDLHHKTESFLQLMHRNGMKVRKLFHHPKLAYIRACAS